MFLKSLRQKIRAKIASNEKLNMWYLKNKEHFWFYFICMLTGIYLYGIAINSFIDATHNFTNGTENRTLSLNPIKCFAAVFTPQGLGVLLFVLIMYFLIAGKWIYLITGVKITKDERNFYVTNEGTHGTSGWMSKKERDKILLSGTADSLPCPILCKVKNNIYDDDKFAEYVGLRNDCGLNKHIIVYGATGSGKSRGFVKPFIQKMVQMLSGETDWIVAFNKFRSKRKLSKDMVDALIKRVIIKSKTEIEVEFYYRDEFEMLVNGLKKN